MADDSDSDEEFIIVSCLLLVAACEYEAADRKRKRRLVWTRDGWGECEDETDEMSVCEKGKD